MFNISLEGGCLKCGSPCLSAVAAALPACVDPGVAVGGTIGGGVFDLSITAGIGQIIFIRIFMMVCIRCVSMC